MDKTRRLADCLVFLVIVFPVLAIAISSDVGLAHAVSDQNTWYGNMTINLSITQQAIKITSAGNGPFSFDVGNDGTVSGTGSITQNVLVSGIYKGTICHGTGLYVWNYTIGGRSYHNVSTANLIFTFVSSNVQGNVSCQGGGGTRTIPLNNTPVDTFGPQDMQINLNQGASVDSPFLGVGDLKIELIGTNFTSSYSVPNLQQSTVQPTQNLSASIPEFGSLPYMIITIAVIGIVVMSRKFGSNMLENFD